MAFCKTCGAEVPEGTMLCANCAASNAASPVSGGFTPVGGFDSSDMTADNKGSKKGIIIAVAVIAVLVIAGVFLFNLLFAGYKKPIKNVAKGINKIDADKLFHAVIPKDQFDEFEEMIEDEYDDSYKDFVKEYEEEIEDIIKDNKIKHKVKIDFKGKKKVSGKTKDAIEETASALFEDMGLDEVEVKKAYRVKVELDASVKYKKEKMSVGSTAYIYVVKYKGCSGWYLAPYADEDSLGDWSTLATELAAPIMMGSMGGFDYDDFDF